MTDTNNDYKSTTFCWCCGRKLWNKNKPVVKEIDGLPRTLHKFCSKHIEWMSKALHEDDKE